MPTTTTRRRKSKLLKYLPKAASAVSFQNPVFSPGREKQRLNSHSGFSGPMVSIIPDEARRRPRRGGDHDDEETQEPSSPKVSCIGQIKLHKNKNKKIIASKKKESSSTQSATHSHNHDYKPVKRDEHDHDHQRKKEGAKAKKQGSKTRKIFGIGFGSRKVKNNDNSKSSGRGAGEGGESAHSEPAPSLGHMKRFSSGRQSLANFDWTAQIAPVNDLEDRNFHSDEEFGRCSDSEEEDEEEVKIPFSAPMLMGGGGYCEPRKEVNLWERRNTATPPPPLKLN